MMFDYFLGIFKGKGKPVSVSGSRSSGLEFYGETRQGAIKVRLYRLNKQDRVMIELHEHNGHGMDRLLLDTPIDGSDDPIRPNMKGPKE